MSVYINDIAPETAMRLLHGSIAGPSIVQTQKSPHVSDNGKQQTGTKIRQTWQDHRRS
ncbi:hypothetical protein [Paracoccus sp. IB05]|uniref:hypothetical protein n=1 Tax=Paracoccus sp. IB05 TaxID=2779367 RepID=UPI0018E83833|nr:hypothetical protein [Paracoccus sp. IB05]MBJ2152021.1 hypothetical protein [Paracoccus sp. IB05]